MELNYTYDETLGIPKVTKAKITGIYFSLDYELMLKLKRPYMRDWRAPV